MSKHIESVDPLPPHDKGPSPKSSLNQPLRVDCASSLGLLYYYHHYYSLLSSSCGTFL